MGFLDSEAYARIVTDAERELQRAMLYEVEIPPDQDILTSRTLRIRVAVSFPWLLSRTMPETNDLDRWADDGGRV